MKYIVEWEVTTKCYVLLEAASSQEALAMVRDDSFRDATQWSDTTGPRRKIKATKETP